MSKYINILNKIKEQCTYEWLTHSQKEIFDRIATGLGAHKLINIYGDQAIGKTFMGWIFQKTHAFAYANDITEIPEYQLVVLDDNNRFSRSETRVLRPLFATKNIQRIILLTRRQIQDDVPSFHLILDHDDVAQVCNNLYMKLDFRILEECGMNLNLRDLIIANIT
jgi:hypothetical protein